MNSILIREQMVNKISNKERSIQYGRGDIKIPTIIINRKAGDELLRIINDAGSDEVIGHFEFDLYVPIIIKKGYKER